MSLAKLYVVLSAKTEEFQKEMKSATDKIGKFGADAEKIGKSLTKNVTLPLVGVGVAAFKLGKDFESEMSKITGLVGVSQDQVNAWGKDILQMAPQLGKAPKELAEGLFFVTSAGIKGSEAMDVLRQSAELSVAGLGETKTIADLLTSAINAYGKENLSATKAADILTAAVREGKLEASEMAPVIGNLLPTASSLGLGFEQVAGTLAVFSRTGMDAARGATSLSGIMTTMLKPSEGARKALASVGLEMKDLRDIASSGPDGLVKAMRLLDESFKGNDEALAQVIPEVEAFRGVMNILAQDSKVVDSIMQGVSKSTGDASTAFDVAKQTTEQLWQQGLAGIQVAGIKLWEVLQVQLIPIMQSLTENIQKATEWFSNLDPKVQQTIVSAAMFAAALGPVILVVSSVAQAISFLGGIITPLIPTVAGLTAAKTALAGAFAFLTGPIGIVIAAIVAVGAAVVYLWNTNEEFRNTVTTIWSQIQELASTVFNFIKTIILGTWDAIMNSNNVVWSTIRDAINNAWTGITNIINGALTIIQGILNVVLGVITLDWSRAWDGIKQILSGAWDAIVGIVQLKLSAKIAIITNAWSLVKSATSSAYESVKNTISNIWDSIKSTISNIVSGIRNFIQTNFGEQLNSIRSIMTSIQSNISNVWNIVKNIVLGALLMLVNLVTGNFGKMRSDATAIMNNIKNSINQIWQNIKNIFSQALNIIKTTAINAWNNIKTVTSTALNAMKTFISTAWENIKTTISTAMTNVKTAIETGFESALSYLRGLPSTLLSLGKSIIGGLIEGINAKMGEVAGAVSRIAGSVSSGLRSALRISSPSKVMIEIGKNIMEGLAKGMSDNAIRALDAVKNMGRDIIAETNRLGDAIITALKNKYDRMEALELAKLYGTDASNNPEIARMLAEIDAINTQTTEEEKALKEQEYQYRKSAKEIAISQAKSVEEQIKLQEELNEMILKHEREKLLESRRNKIEGIQKDIELEKQRAQQERDVVKDKYDKLREEENIQAEARRLALDTNNKELLRLLHNFNPKWEDAGRSFGESLIFGLNSTKMRMHKEIEEIQEMFQGIQNARIVDAKIQWEAAHAAGDKAGMAAAHRLAELARLAGGTIKATDSLANIKIPGLATGGHVLDDGAFIVGEKGPELLSNMKGATVEPLKKGYGGITQYVTINSPTPLSPSETARRQQQASRQLALEWGV